MARAILVAMLLTALPAAAGADAAALVGTWRGESRCTVKPDAVTITGNKVVDGKEVTMGVFECTWDAPRNTLSCPIRLGRFVYQVDGKTMRGTLTLDDGTLFRRVSAQRVD